MKKFSAYRIFDENGKSSGRFVDLTLDDLENLRDRPLMFCAITAAQLLTINQLTQRIPNDSLLTVNSIQTTEAFDAWFTGLKDRQAVRRVQVRIDRAEDGNFGDCQPASG